MKCYATDLNKKIMILNSTVCVCVRVVCSCESLTDTLVTQLASGFLAYKLPLVTQFKYSRVCTRTFLIQCSNDKLLTANRKHPL